MVMEFIYPIGSKENGNLSFLSNFKLIRDRTQSLLVNVKDDLTLLHEQFSWPYPSKYYEFVLI